ncbi:GNAT family N-acetyltransferase [Nocardioides jejuensis]|jgi:predicted GNAT family acetyltransferase|uniref:N-acetyltransferase n=1 Tax=Nocardioides jejuensis TaxID=2502782 RepID=A0A4R1CCE4_9ACTN|nr:GNAT family N-acetyltransferase [Nocardioides jejuensis]TCJ28620.1 N-acetyltransferase [Nocardioides jejuensis]
MSEIVVRDNPAEHRYEIHVDGSLAGFTVYEPHEGLLAFVHTEIDEAYAGQGLAKILIRETLDDVRARGLVLLPFCPFVRGFIQKNRDYVDLVPEDQRARFDLA